MSTKSANESNFVPFGANLFNSFVKLSNGVPLGNTTTNLSNILSRNPLNMTAVFVSCSSAKSLLEGKEGISPTTGFRLTNGINSVSVISSGLNDVKNPKPCVNSCSAASTNPIWAITSAGKNSGCIVSPNCFTKACGYNLTTPSPLFNLNDLDTPAAPNK